MFISCQPNTIWTEWVRSIVGQPETREFAEPEDDDKKMESLFAFAVFGFLRSCGLEGKSSLVYATAKRDEKSAF